MILDSSRLAKRASQLRISAISIAEGMTNGQFKSLYRGQGIEFSDVREYLTGDNVRSIDWNVTARMGKAFIKQYEEDKELSVILIVDCSKSMEAPSQNKTRLSKAIEAAALLLLACEHNNAAIGAVFFDGKILFSTEPKAGRKNSMIILSKLDKIENTPESEKTNGSVLSNAIKGAQKLLKKRSLVFIISDFRSTKWEKPLAQLSQKNDVIALRITDQTDSELPPVGTVSFSDCETAAQTIFPTRSNHFKSRWHEANLKRTEQWNNFCIKHGARTLQIDTKEDCVGAFLRFFKQRGQ